MCYHWIKYQKSIDYAWAPQLFLNIFFLLLEKFKGPNFSVLVTMYARKDYEIGYDINEYTIQSNTKMHHWQKRIKVGLFVVFVLYPPHTSITIITLRTVIEYASGTEVCLLYMLPFWNINIIMYLLNPNGNIETQTMQHMVIHYTMT